MDSYDLFGDDVSGSVLDGLPDLGSEAFGDSSATGPGPSVRDPGGGSQQQVPYGSHGGTPSGYPSGPSPATQQQQPQAQGAAGGPPPVGGATSGESPLQKLATFGDYSTHQQQQQHHMDPYGGGHYDPSRPMVGGYPMSHEMPPQAPPPPQQSRRGRGHSAQQQQQQQQQQQYPGYGEGMYPGAGMEAAAAGSAEHMPWPGMPYRSQSQQQQQYQMQAGYGRHQQMGYEALGQQKQPAMGQYGGSNSAMMGSQLMPSQQQQGQYSVQQQQQQQRMMQQQQNYPETPASSGQMYPGGQQGSYPSGYGQSAGHQRFPYQQYPQQPKSKQQVQQQQQQHELSGYNHQMPHHHQYQQPHSGMGHYPQSSKHPSMQQPGPPPSMGGASPQYRAPYPQLSPQMSPRPPQMSPRPPQPSSKLSPHHQHLTSQPSMSPGRQPSSKQQQPQLNQPPGSSPGHMYPGMGQAPSTLQALEQMVMPPSSSEYPSSAGAYSRQSQQQQQQQSGPSPGMIPSPMQQANMAGRNPLSPQPWPQQRQQQASGHMSGPPTPQQQPMASQQQMNGGMMSGGTMQEIPSSQSGMPLHLTVPPSSMDTEAHMTRPRSQDAQSAQQTVPDPSSEGDSRRPPDQSEFSLDKFVEGKEHAVEKQEEDKPKPPDAYSTPDFGAYQGDSSNSQPPKSDSESYQATPPPAVSAAGARPSSRPQSSNGMAANGPPPPHAMGMGMSQLGPHGMSQAMAMGGPPHGMPPSMHPSMQGPGGMHMMGPPGHMMDMHGGFMPGGPMGHQQEMAALQQQLQEFYCMPQQTPDIQSKTAWMQERLQTLQQHCATTPCMGPGAHCNLPSPMPLPSQSLGIDHIPPVPTTGRGRGKGSRGQRKPRGGGGKRGAKHQAQIPSPYDMIPPSNGEIMSHLPPYAQQPPPPHMGMPNMAPHGMDPMGGMGPMHHMPPGMPPSMQMQLQHGGMQGSPAHAMMQQGVHPGQQSMPPGPPIHPGPPPGIPPMPVPPQGIPPQMQQLPPPQVMPSSIASPLPPPHMVPSSPGLPQVMQPPLQQQQQQPPPPQPTPIPPLQPPPEQLQPEHHDPPPPPPPMPMPPPVEEEVPPVMASAPPPLAPPEPMEEMPHQLEEAEPIPEQSDDAPLPEPMETLEESPMESENPPAPPVSPPMPTDLLQPQEQQAMPVVPPQPALAPVDEDPYSIEEFDEKQKKPKTPRKPREPKKPKEPKVPKEPKEKKSKKKEDGEDSKGKSRKSRKKKDSEQDSSVLEEESKDDQSIDAVSSEMKESESPSDTPTQDDDAKVDTKGEGDEPSESSAPATPIKKEAKKRIRLPKSVSTKRNRSLKSMMANKGKKGRRGLIGKDSDGPSDMEGTPPPSPPPEDDSVHKRRSARNTQRKKYTDDIELSISDEEIPGNLILDSNASTPKGGNKAEAQSPDETQGGASTPAAPGTPTASSTSSGGKKAKAEEEQPAADSNVKPNFVYINTGDEDSMVVQYVLAVRMGRRPAKKPEAPPATATADQEGEKKPEEKAEPDQESEAIKPEPKEEESQSIDEKKNEEEDEKADHDKTVQQHKFHLDEVTAAEDMEEVEEYFVKYRSFSYLHCEWRTEEELVKGDKRVSAKLKRFKQKQTQQCNIFETLDEEPFNPDYTEVDRVLDVAEHEDPNGSGAPTKHFLVKWRSLQYEDSTWELEEDVDPEKIQNYLRWQKVPPKEQWKPKKRPRPEDWKKLNESPVYKNDNKLREYQLEGLNWLLFSWYNGRNCILADEMGLGKTIQSLTFIHAVHQYGIRGPFLVVAPLSTIPNWQREFEAWTDLNVVVYHGSSASRNMLTEYEVFFKDTKGNVIKDVTKFNVLITTFEIIISDVMELRPFNWRLCVIDEAHRLKNRNCKLLEGLRLLNLEHRVLLSGTPLQNNVNELFSLLNFLEPTQFSSSESFLEEFGQLKDETEVQKLQVLLKPMMLRRLKEDVEKSIAPKEETVIEVELTNIQKKYYRAILERNFSFLSKGTTSANVPSLMNTMMELRKCCIHPYLLNGAEDQIHIEFRQAQGEDPDAYYKALIQSSGKMVLVDKLLPKLKANGHRVLVFSQMVRCLDILEDYLVYRKYPFERIDGRIRGNLRQAAIDRFSKPDSDRFVFLLCTKAGGLGINLTAADTVIIYDSDWNPQNDLQAQARCHRIGQQKMVKVYRLLCRNTYEREMFDKASLKLGLDKAVLQSMNTAQGGKDPNSKQLTKKEIEDLLKKGAYGAIMDEDEGDKFCEEDIDQILERRTQVITLESEKGSTFSKASFASSGIRSDIDIDDPDFWVKWAKKADIDMKDGNDLSELVISEPRRRTQIKRYGQDESVMDMSELDSSSDSDEDGGVRGTRSGRKHKTKFGRIKARRYEEYATEGDVVYGSWSRSECFKVEKGLLTYGWGRWNEILITSQFRQGWRESDVEDLARVIVLYCLRMFRGDEKLRQFSWDLVTPPEFATDKSANQQGGRGRKSKKRPVDDTSQDWSRDEKYDGDIFLEGSYKKHLFRHSTKVLLRIRMLHYIKHDIVGELAQQITDGVALGHLPLAAVPTPQELPPSSWWGPHDDQSLVVGVYKHGYENYALMRADPCLSFLAMCGPPTKAELEAQGTQQTKRKQITDEELGKISDDDEAEAEPVELEGEHPVEGGDKAPWPSVADLNTRLRRVISSYQRNFKREEMKMAQRAKNEKREKMEQLLRGRHHHAALEAVRRWSRKEEADFFRTVSSFGVEYDRKRGQYDWNKFRSISRLERKQDEAMTEYYRAFCTMLKRVCGMKLTEDEELLDIVVDPISEEKARRTLERLDLLNKVREETIFSPNLEERLKLCQPSPDLPEWWLPGKHDKELLLGAAKHGLGRTEAYILNDADFSFRDVMRQYACGQVPAHVRSAARKAEESEVKKSKEEEEAAIGAIKLERPEDILRIDKDEIIVKLEKGEGTLKIEKIGMKKDLAPTTALTAAPASVKEDKDEVELTIVAPKPDEEEKQQGECNEKPVEEPAEESAVKEVTEKPKSPAEIEKPEEEAEKKEESEQQPEEESEIKETKEDEKENKEEKLEEEEEKMEVDEEIKPDEKMEDTESDKPSADVEKSKPETSKKEKKSKKERAAEKAAAAAEEAEKPEPRCTRRKSQAAAAAAAAEARAKSIDSKPKTPEETKEEEKMGERAASPEKEKEPEKIDVDEENTGENKEEKREGEDKVEVPEGAEKDGKQEEPTLEMEKESEKEEKEPEKPEEKIIEKEKPVAVKEKEQTASADVPLPPPDLKALFPDLEVIQPLSKLAELDTFVFRDKRDFSSSDLSLAHMLAAQSSFHTSKFSWPKDNVLQSRLEQVVIAVDSNEWPPPRPIPPFPSDLEIFANTPPGGTPRRDTPTLSLEEQQLADLHGVMLQHAHQQGLSISRASAMAAAALASKKRKRQHIAIDVETERAKLHALLQNSHLQASKLWDDESLSEESRRSTPNQSALGQPPPAHQNTSSRVLNMPLSPFELKFHTGASSSAVAAAAAKGGLMGPTLIPGTSSTLTPIDLSSGFYHSLPKMECPTSSALDVSRARGGDDGGGEAPQDFSLPSKNKKSRLDDMLDKLMKRKQEEPAATAGGKEKKRRKLDEIVMGLSSAKAEQQQAAHAGVAELIKKTAATISVVGGTNTSPAHQQPPSHLPPPPGGATLHPLLRPHVHKGAPTPSNHPPISSASKPPFTITVTSVPSSAASSSSRAPPPPMPPISSAACKDTFSLLPQPDLAASLALLTGASGGKKGSSLGMSLPSAHSKMSSTAAAAAAYEAVLADMNKMADLSAKVSSYSQEAKWLSEQSGLVNNELTADFLARRRKPRQEQTPPILDWKKITGEENIPVINRSTGKKLTGSKAPSLKQLGQWLLENPMFEIDPKWNEMLKEMGNFPTSASSKRGGGSGQQSSASAAAGSSSGQGSSKKSSSSRSVQQASASDANSLAAAAMGLPFNPSLAALSGLNPSLLSSLGLGGFDPKNPLAGFDPKSLGFDPKSLGFDPKSLGFDPKSLGFDPKSLGFDPKSLGFDPKSLGFDPKSLGFDPKNPLGPFDPKNPLLLPAFAAAAGSMPSMSSLAGLSGFGGLSSNLFANLASLGFGLDGSEGQAASTSAGSSKSKSRSSAPKESKSSLSVSQAAAVSSASASIPTSSLNLFFPNPSLLYTPLGLGGLNPFGSSPSSLGSAYDNLVQQSQLLNGMGTSSATTITSSSKGHRSSGQSSSSNHKRASSALEKQQQQIQRLLLQQQLDAANELARAQLEKAAAKAAEDEPKSSGRHKSKSRSQGLGSLTKLEETVSKLAERKGLRNKVSREGSEEKEAAVAAAAAETEADQPPDEKQAGEEEKAPEEEA